MSFADLELNIKYVHLAKRILSSGVSPGIDLAMRYFSYGAQFRFKEVLYDVLTYDAYLQLAEREQL